MLFSWHLLEILVSGLLVIYSATTPARKVLNARRTLTLTLINVVAVILMFAVADRWLATNWPEWAGFRAGQGQPLRQEDFLYMSWTNLTTLGNSFNPVTIPAQALIVAEVSSGLLLLTVIVASILGAVKVNAD